MQKYSVMEEEIDRVYKELVRVRGKDDLPTRQEVKEMIIRMKKRWGVMSHTG
jgi:hypothetical protein